MELHVDDAGFVRAPAPLVYRRLTHVAAWPGWWRGIRVRELERTDTDETFAIELVGARGRRLRYEIRAHGWRHEHGFLLAIRGDVVGAAEFWLEATHGGTIVHHLLVGTTSSPRPVRVLTDHRLAIRRGLWGLKDAVQLEARTSIGLVP